MRNKDSEEVDVIDKLDKVADSLERSTVQLTGVVTQQQLDVLRERVAAMETELQTIRTGVEATITRSAAHADEAEDGIEALVEEHSSLERDFAGMRALVITSFVLSSIALIGLILLRV